MDISALLSGLITDKTVQEVSKKSGASKKDVSSVLTTALPLLLTNGSNTSSAQVSKQSGVSQSTTNNVLSSAAPMLLNMVGGQNSQPAAAAGNAALLGALLGKVDLGKLTSGLMGLVSTNTASEAKPEAATTTSGKKKPAAKKPAAKKPAAKKTDSKKKTDGKKTSTTGKKTTAAKKTSSAKKTGTTAKKSAPESTLDKVTGLLGNLLK